MVPSVTEDDDARDAAGNGPPTAGMTERRSRAHGPAETFLLVGLRTYPAGRRPPDAGPAGRGERRCCGCGCRNGSGTARAPGRAWCSSARASGRTPAGRLPPLGDHRPGRAGHRPRPVDRHPLRQRVDAPDHRRGPAGRRPGHRGRGQRLRPARGPRPGAAVPRPVRAAQPRQRRRHQVRAGPALDAAPLAGSRPAPAGAGRRAESPRDPRRHALAADHDVLPDVRGHEERADTRSVPGLGARVPSRPAAVHQRGVRAAGARAARG
jgi:hypothetical protein